MSGAFAFPPSFEYQATEQKHHEHHFYNPDLNFFLSYSSGDLNAQAAHQKNDILDRVPQTGQLHSIYNITYRRRPLDHAAPPDGKSILGIPCEMGIMDGACFGRVRKRGTFSRDEINTLLLTYEDMQRRQAMGLMFQQNGLLVTRPEFETNWQAACLRTRQTVLARDADGAVVFHTNSLKGEPYFY